MRPLLAVRRSFSASACESMASSVPVTRHWCTLEAVVQGFISSLNVNNIDDLKHVIGTRAYKSFFVGAIEHKYCGTKELFVPGSASNYPLKLLVSFLKELNAKVNMRLLVACHDSSPESLKVISEHGGHAAVGKSLGLFRHDILTFASDHADVLFGIALP